MQYDASAQLAGAVLGLSAGKETNKKYVPLDDVERFADAVELATCNVKAFTNRFYATPECASSTDVRAVPTGYHGQLTRLGTALDELNKAVERLSDIG